jgi:hypothetical protein
MGGGGGGSGGLLSIVQTQQTLVFRRTYVSYKEMREFSSLVIRMLT